MRAKKRSIKGFTLIEVLVALAILGICSLLLVGMYGSVCTRMKNNNEINDRMSEQQKYVETKTQKSAANKDLFDVKVDSSVAGNPMYDTDTPSGAYKFEMVCVQNNANTAWNNSKNFVVNCAVYTLKNIEDGEPVASDDDDFKVDYKYFVGDNYMQ